MHRILEEQIKRFLGNTEQNLPQLTEFLQKVNDTYIQLDENQAHLRELLEKSTSKSLENSQLLLTMSTAAQQSSDTYKRLVDNLSVGVYRNTPGPQGHFLEANPAMVTLFEADSKENLLKHNVSDLYKDPEKRKLFAEKLMKFGFVKNEELDLVTLKGKHISCSVNAVMKKAQDGTIYFDGIVEDITERKHMLEELRRSHSELEQRIEERTKSLQIFNEKLRLQSAALESAENTVFITDTDGKIQWINPSFVRLTGYTTEEAIGYTPRIFKSGKQLSPYYQQLWNTILAGKSWHSEVINRRKDGSIYTVDQTITPVKDENGKITNFVAIQQDITARKRAEEEIKRTNEELEHSKGELVKAIEALRIEKENVEKEKARDEATLVSIGEGLIAVDNDRNITLMNREAERLIGCDKTEVLGKQYETVILLEDEKGKTVPFDKRPLSLALSARPVVTSKAFYLVSKDTSKFPVAITVSPIVQDKKIIGAIEVFRDITKEKEIDKVKTEFVSLASHQLRTPLTAINWNIEMLRSGSAGELNDKQKELLKDVYDGSQRMVQLVNDLLSVSRLDSGRFLIHVEPTNLKDFIMVFEKELETQLHETGCSISFTFPEENIPDVPIDRELFKQVIMNLLTNAIRYSSAHHDGRVNVSLSVRPEGYRIEVRDNGIGIPREAWSRVFEKFYRADNARLVESNGTGLGLYFAYAILDATGGSITFDTELGKGTTFYVTIPLGGMKAKVIKEDENE